MSLNPVELEYESDSSVSTSDISAVTSKFEENTQKKVTKRKPCKALLKAVQKDDLKRYHDVDITAEVTVLINEAHANMPRKRGRKPLPKPDKILKKRGRKPIPKPDKILKKRGRKPLTEEERQASKHASRLYFKNYYLTHPEKFKTYTAGKTYNNSCIFKMWSPKCKSYFIGSTKKQLDKKLANILDKMKKSNCPTVLKMMKEKCGLDWYIEPLIKVPLKTLIELQNLETIYITCFQDMLFNKSKKYNLETIQDIMKEFPTSYLPIKAQKFLKQ